MSLVYFELTNVTIDSDIDSLWAQIAEKTGIEVTLQARAGTASYRIAEVKFPDMEEPQEVEVIYKANGYSSKNVAFVDVENHFLAFISYNTSAVITPNSPLYQWLNTLIIDDNGTLKNFSTVSVSSGIALYETANIPRYLPNKVSETITISPLYFANANSMKEGMFIPNTYVNCEKSFPVGTKFVDDNGNEFVSIIGYLLYLNKRKGE